MKTYMKRICCVLVCLCMLLSMTPIGLAAHSHEVHEQVSTEDRTPVITSITLSGRAVTFDETLRRYTITIPSNQNSVELVMRISGENLDKISAYDWIVDVGSANCVVLKPNQTVYSAIVDTRAISPYSHPLRYTDGTFDPYMFPAMMSKYYETGYSVLVQSGEPSPEPLFIEAQGPDSDDYSFGTVQNGTYIWPSGNASPSGDYWTDTDRGNLLFNFGYTPLGSEGDRMVLGICDTEYLESAAGNYSTYVNIREHREYMDDLHRAMFDPVEVYENGLLGTEHEGYAVVAVSPIIEENGATVLATAELFEAQLPMPCVFTQEESFEPAFLSDYMYQYAESLVEDGEVRLGFRHIPATLRFAIKNPRESELMLSSVKVRLADEAGTIAYPVAAEMVTMSTDAGYWLDLSYTGEYTEITTNTETTLKSGEIYVAYALALPLADQSAFEGKKLQIVIDDGEHSFVAMEVDGDEIADANYDYFYNWNGGCSYTFYMEARCFGDCTFDTNGLCSVCGAKSEASVSIPYAGGIVGSTTTYYATLDEAVQAVADCTAADRAVLTIQRNIDLGNAAQKIASGTFTMDLNGFSIKSSACVLNIEGGNVTITDSDLTQGGVIDGNCAINAKNCNLIINGGNICGTEWDLQVDKAEICLTLGENGVGATFPGGIRVSGTTLNALLADRMAYWQGETKILCADDQTELEGDVTVKKACNHANGIKENYVAGYTEHSYTYSCCGEEYFEAHKFEGAVCTDCGAVRYDIWVAETQVMSSNAHDVLGDGTIRFDADTCTLTLNGASVDTSELGIPAVKIISGDVKLVLQGDNSLIASDKHEPEHDDATDTFYGYAAIEIAEGASVSIDGSDDASLSLQGNAFGYTAMDHIAVLAAVSGGGELSICGGKITTGGILLDGDYRQTGGDVNTNYISAKNVSVSDGILFANGNSGIIYMDPNGGGCFGICASENIQIFGGTVNAVGNGLASSSDFSGILRLGAYGSDVLPDGLRAGVKITVKGGTVTACGSATGYRIDDMGNAAMGGFGEPDGLNGYAIDAPSYSISENATFICGTENSHLYNAATCQSPAICDFCRASTGEKNPDHHDEAVAYVNGICPNGCYEPATLSGNVYEIGNAGQLYWFAKKVNGGDRAANAILTADIDLGGREWTPIASTALYYKTTSYSDKGYEGIFDGQGHVISGMYVTTSATVEQTYGLFGTLSGTVKNLGMTGVSYTFPNDAKDLRAGGIVGQMLNGSRVENCYVTDSSITPGQYIVGGIAACNYAGTIEHCFTRNVAASGNERCGNLVSDIRGDISATDRPGEVINCYTDAQRVHGTQKCDSVPAVDCQANVDAARFASGEIAYLLGDAFGQSIGADALPVLGGEKVYYAYLSCADSEKTYTNDANATPTKPTHSWTDATCQAPKTCSVCGETEGTVTGHSFDESGKCINCRVRTLTVKMTEKYGGSWDGNAIEVYEDGQLITTLTIAEYGEDGTRQLIYDPEKVYAFKWVKGNWSYDCSFEILFGTESVFTASNNDCDTFVNGQTVFTTCTHDGNTNEDDGDCTTAFYCSQCGWTLMYAKLNHTPGNDCTYDELTHSFTCTVCGTVVEGEHSIVHKVCFCGMTEEDVVAVVTIKGVAKGYTALADAIDSVKYTAAEDEAAIKLVKNIDLGEDALNIYGGVFTLDLNDCTVTSAATFNTFFMVSSANVTVIDSGEEGIGEVRHTGSNEVAFDVNEGTLNLEDGKFSAIEVGDNATLNISGEAEIAGKYFAVKVNGGTANIRGGTFASKTRSSWYGTIYVIDGQAIITGGEIKAFANHIAFSDAGVGSVTLTQAEDSTMGTTFVDGIKVYKTTIAGILGEGMSCWAGDVMLSVDDNATEITNKGTITVKATCDHSANKNTDDNDCTTAFACSECANVLAEAQPMHIFDESGKCNNCETNASSILTVKMTDKYGASWYGNAIEVYEDGQLITTLTIAEYGEDGTRQLIYNPEKVYAFKWVKGNRPNDCSFEILFGTESVFAASNDDCEAFANGQIVFTTCTHDGNTNEDDGDCTTAFCCSQCGWAFAQAKLNHTPGNDCTYDELTHSFTCAVCDTVVEGEHSFVDKFCFCGKTEEDVVAVVTIKDVAKGYTDLEDAIDSVKYTAAEDAAVVKLVKNIDLGTKYMYIYGGVFTLDLNDCTITSAATFTAFYIFSGVNVTVIDSGEEGIGEVRHTGSYEVAFDVSAGTLNLEDGKFSAIEIGDNATLNISGEAEIIGYNYAVKVDGGTANISGGTLTSETYNSWYGTIYVTGGQAIITGGEIKSLGKHIAFSNAGVGSVTLTLAEDSTMGATFPGGITVYNTTLNEILAEGMAYWQDSKQLYLADGNTSITGGDVVIKAACTHENGTVSCVPNGEKHSFIYSCCGYCPGESEHTYDDGVTKEATCTESGGIFYTCADCGHIRVTNEVAKLGHNFGDDAICDACGHDVSNLIIINMFDLRGDGWNGNNIAIYIDGKLVKTITMEDGREAQYEMEYDPEKIYVMRWISAAFIYECSYEIIVGGVLQSEGSNPTNGELIYTNCAHSYEGVVTPPTCTEDGYTTYVCTVCGKTHIADEIPAPGHDYGADDICTVCGEAAVIAITMHDYFGDGWGGNAISVYENGILIKTVTLESGSEATVTIDYSSDSIYRFDWILGEWPGECGFEIALKDEVVYENQGAQGLEDGVTFFVICEHRWSGVSNEAATTCERCGTQAAGWIQFDGNWYYIDEESGMPKTGVKRVPYPTEPINGITYGPDQEAMDYCQANGTEFIDAEKGWFRFDSEGVFCASFTGQYDYYYFENGFMTWHPGLTEYNGRYYYFIGDMQYGGNKTASGNVYVSKNQTDLDITIGGVYTFNTYGRLCEYDGITDIDGTLYYYEDYQLMIGAGLVEIDGDYYYVRSNGALVVGQSYWVANSNGLDIPAGEYEFDSNGKLILPPPALDGIVEVDGVLYYYTDGAIAYGAGVIEIDGNYYYVRSNGQLVRGQAYYITTVGDTGVIPGRYRFNDEGVMQNPRFESQGAQDGIVDGYYYVDGKIAYGAGLLYLEDEGCYIYVRSNGQLATRRYWVTANNDLLPCGLYDFGFDGKLFIKSGTSSRR